MTDKEEQARKAAFAQAIVDKIGFFDEDLSFEMLLEEEKRKQEAEERERAESVKEAAD